MAPAWSLRRQIAAGIFLSIVILAGLVASAFIRAGSVEKVDIQMARSRHAILVMERLLGRLSAAEAAQRAFLLLEQEELLVPYEAAVRESEQAYVDLRRLTAEEPEQQRRFEKLRSLMRERFGELSASIERHRRDGREAAAQSLGEARGRLTMGVMKTMLEELSAAERARLAAVEEEVSRMERRIFGILLGATGGAALLIIVIGLLFGRMNRTIGDVVERMQRSSTELQAASTQQVRGAKEQSTSSQEVSATIHELLATSRQIAERARRVTEVATHTAAAARTGDQAVEKADLAIAAILDQVRRIVSHMLSLGRKSQEIGAILDIINDLTEETNILAINATVEAAGAGEAGRRFSVVADEIRKLSDRTGVSAREIRALIEEIRSAANTTVMATESGSKAAEAGAIEFRDVAVNFRRIVELVGSTAEAAREIELSTKQQTSAVEQINSAIAEVAESAQQTEASSSQTLSTSSELSDLSRELAALIKEPARA